MNEQVQRKQMAKVYTSSIPRFEGVVTLYKNHPKPRQWYAPSRLPDGLKVADKKDGRGCQRRVCFMLTGPRRGRDSQSIHLAGSVSCVPCKVDKRCLEIGLHWDVMENIECRRRQDAGEVLKRSDGSSWCLTPPSPSASPDNIQRGMNARTLSGVLQIKQGVRGLDVS